MPARCGQVVFRISGMSYASPLFGVVQQIPARAATRATRTLEQQSGSSFDGSFIDICTRRSKGVALGAEASYGEIMGYGSASASMAVGGGRLVARNRDLDQAVRRTLEARIRPVGHRSRAEEKKKQRRKRRNKCA